MKMALPRNGLRGVEKTADTTAWTNSMAESGGAQVKDQVINMYAMLYITSAFQLLRMSLIKHHAFKYTDNAEAQKDF